MWNILSGSTKSKFVGNEKYYTKYNAEVLWRLIPNTMRPWWIDSVQTIDEETNSFSNVTIDYPESIFCDKTIQYEKYQSDYDSQKLCRIIDAMNNNDIIDRNILCPWGCSTSFRERGSVPFDIMIQKILPRIIVLTYTDKSKHRFIQSSWNQYFRNNNDYPKILLNNDWVV